MRNLKFLAVALLIGAPFVVAPAEAAMPRLSLGPVATPNIVEVAVHCGPHAHYIRGHRAKTHEWIKGRCIRDHR
jgi:hypothetical protein